MKKIIKEYCYVIGNLLIGIAFGFAFFYLFLNFYHYQELRRVSRIDVKNDSLIASIDESLMKSMKNINSFSANNYKGSLDYSTAYSLNAKLKNCVTKIQNAKYLETRDKTEINIKDVYDLRASFETDVLNGCIALHLYPLITESKDSYFSKNRDLIVNYTNLILRGTSDLENNLYDTSNYYFTTDNYSSTVSNKVRSGFYETLTSYNDAAKLLEELSEWYASRVGGNIND